MTAMTTLPFSRPLTRADLESLPTDDGHRYELIDGVLIVSPGPRHGHQTVVGNVYLRLREACPAGLQVLFAPFAVALSDDTEVQPDLLVAPRSQFTDKELPGPPLLAVEVLSPSTRRVDLLLKRDRLQSAGVPSYWLVDPDEPSIIVLDLVDGTYVETLRAGPGQTASITLPFPCELVIDRFLD